MRKYAQKIEYIQKRFKDQLATRFAKVEVLSNYWDKMVGQLQTRASKKHDKEASDLVLKFILVPKDVKLELLREWVTCCRTLFSIAFLQWRMIRPSKLKFDKK